MLSRCEGDRRVVPFSFDCVEYRRILPTEQGGDDRVKLFSCRRQRDSNSKLGESFERYTKIHFRLPSGH